MLYHIYYDAYESKRGHNNITGIISKFQDFSISCPITPDSLLHVLNYPSECITDTSVQDKYLCFSNRFLIFCRIIKASC